MTGGDAAISVALALGRIGGSIPMPEQPDTVANAVLLTLLDADEP